MHIDAAKLTFLIDLSSVSSVFLRFSFVIRSFSIIFADRIPIYNVMREKIDCFLPCLDVAALADTLSVMRQSGMVQHIHLLVTGDYARQGQFPGDCNLVVVNDWTSTDTILKIGQYTDADYVLLGRGTDPFSLGLYALDRFLQVGEDSHAAMVYSDYDILEVGAKRQHHPVLDYQDGSLRAQFDFGPLVLIRAQLLHDYAAQPPQPAYQRAGWYDFRLFLSRRGHLFHLNEYLYACMPAAVAPLPEDDMEMERALSHHLSAIGALLDASYYRQPDFNEQPFDAEASVIIPVLNREKTIAEAVASALGQNTSFAFNVIVVDNHSTDGTSRIVEEMAEKDHRLIHLIPSRTDLEIGGCWNMAIADERCGKFAVQLDSDDCYASSKTLQQIVDAFYAQHAGMVIGSYRRCDFNMKPLSGDRVEHREWTSENGCNTVLRMNGIGAPRAYFTPLIRQIKFPNVSYGEDYAVGLTFSRRYRIGRIYDEVYLCRRWEDNVTAKPDSQRSNARQFYKDRLRTLELKARQQMLSGKADSLVDSGIERFFNWQLEKWEEARMHYRDLHQTIVKELPYGDTLLKVQYNPARMVSTGAKVDRESVSKRPCFLCRANRPAKQEAKHLDEQFELLVNPYPILPTHFTIPSKKHLPQRIYRHYGEIHQVLTRYGELTVFYNGPQCGASAPDHLHFQAGTSGIIPLQRGWQRLSRQVEEVMALNDHEGIFVITGYVCPCFLVRSRTLENDVEMFNLLYGAMKEVMPSVEEPMMNIVAWRYNEDYLSVVFPRGKHRPDCFRAEGNQQLMVSPGALDMAGLLIIPRREDFDRITAQGAGQILEEVSITDETMAEIVKKLKSNASPKSDAEAMKMKKQPDVTVGIVSGDKIHFTLNKPYLAKGEQIIGDQVVEFSEGGILWNGNQYRELTFRPKSQDASFSLYDVTIGVNFHWERQETQVFQGALHLVVEEDKICAINELPVENYLESVISSEMRATSSLELLKAHAVISRSWLLAQMERRKKAQEGGDNFFSFTKKEDEIIRWYDREDHTIFDVCADDHCQRYQGITKETSPHVVEAVKATRGQILMSDGQICDARFSKSCGGVSEEYQYCWDHTPKSYLTAVRDLDKGQVPDLTIEENAEKWIRSCPDSFCNTQDKKILSQVLNDYDQETSDFYRWHVTYTQSQLAALISGKMKMDFGDILDLVPLARGKSGRIWRLKIVGTKRSFIIGKELEIRRTLSESHLYSSAFVVDKSQVVNGVPQQFDILGAGWGHGVGLCQIGAAVMGEKGYKYDQILLHYYRGAEIKRIYR